MYSKALIEAYMRAKKYTQYKQVAVDLEFTTAYIASVNRGHKEFTDETATYIAQQVGLDPSQVLLELARARAKTETTKSVWERLIKEHQSSLQAASMLGIGLLSQCLFYFA